MARGIPLFRVVDFCRPTQRFGYEIDKGPHTRRHLMSLWVHGVDVGIRRVVLRQNLNQPAVAQAARNVPLCTHQDSMAVQRPVHSDSAVVGGEIAADLHGLGRLTFGPVKREPPDAIRLVALPDADAVVTGEIAWRLRDSVAG